MKKTVLTSIIIIITISCKAKFPVYSLQNHDYGLDLPAGSYVKDISNDFEKFVGIWKFQDSIKSFEIQLNKKTMFFETSEQIYIDFLIGEYEFKLNGISIVNTIPNINNTTSLHSNNIRGFMFISNSNYPICSNCSPSERRVQLTFKDPDRPWVKAYIVLKYMISLNAEYINATVYESSTLVPDDSTPASLRVPVGNYILTKQ